ncbi:MAG: hypothetical protein CO002_01720 [Candidatus Portnoybacteria bacterium CG_4_8_14_3_um_filter_44_10]|uniref:Uncharacterized protein n=5 Tax=Candidatus Portnoyibacteriota TaxID=1817913 RepID=A0A2H0KRC1_9BACT|nr:MAG: hypothetical protein AUK17_01445 [Parcubacteria group bacterium CG2_30_44_18]PIQ74689.1 MAG: hypothetical protein COV85_00755 [Candidatus Portnoybacteria bacterium CG11_big_fil_rev_8_21_14_0_20_44_10]PIS16703.1 MAG: hypothetical protein COT61_02530 [Candidatus Portnoybacteria bacterium CG09_land_8_20_14_0_10_44_13]PIW75495.1 MAG: hypothetical protein CO002_01720 [Candidatus Portnoybacteria bacterium CG_4_8_14_3_um_filter_44_10]PIZ69519.1 MAG: hypothetical protein COY11_04320 [Candidatus
MNPVIIYKITKWDRKTVLVYVLKVPSSFLPEHTQPAFGEFGTLVYQELIFKSDYNRIINKPPQDLQMVDGKFYPCEPLSEQELRDLFDRYN